jgi:WhiB family redox-sensing transcriptional regulator
MDFTGAKCLGDDRDAYYPAKGTAQVTARDAKAICNGEDGSPVCPVREKCLEYALENRERFGIWGGMSERQRAAIARNRRVAAVKRELEVEAAQVKRAAAARRGWENRRRRAVERQQEHAAKVVALGAKKKSKGQRATQEAPARRRRSA